MKSPRRVAFAGDWHGTVDFAECILKDAAQQGADLVIQVGDFGLRRDEVGSRFADNVDSLCSELAVHVLWVDGNHDDHDLLEEIPRVGGLGRVRDHIWHVPRGTRWRWRGLAWGGLGGAASVDRLTRESLNDWWPQESLTKADVAHWVVGGPVDVVVTHDAPAGVNVPGRSATTGTQWWGSNAMAEAQANRELLADALVPTRPSLVVHGHFHVRHHSTWSYPGGRACIVGLDGDGGNPAANLWVADMRELGTIAADMRSSS